MMMKHNIMKTIIIGMRKNCNMAIGTTTGITLRMIQMRIRGLMYSEQERKLKRHTGIQINKK